MIFRTTFLCLLFSAVVPASLAEAAPQQQFRYWNSSWDFEEIDLANVSSKLAALGIDVPVAMRGKATVNLNVSVPWNAIRNAKAYKIQGTIRGSNVNVDQLRLTQLGVDVNLANGVLRIPNLDLEQQAGSIKGNLTAEVVPKGNFEGRFKAATFDVQPLIALLAKFDVVPRGVVVRGDVGFDIEAQGSTQDVSDASRWTASGTAKVRSVQLSRGSLATPAVSGNIERVALSNGALRIDGLVLRADQRSDLFVRGNAVLPVTDTGAFSVDLAANDFDYGAFADIWWPGLESIVQGKIDMIAKARGSLVNGEPEDYSLAARVGSPNLSVAGLKLGIIEHEVAITERDVSVTRLSNRTRTAAESAIDSLKARYAMDEQRLLVESIDARLFGGSLAGTLELSRIPDGWHRANLKWQGIAPAARVTLPFASRPTTLTGSSSGSLQWQSVAKDLANPARQRGRVSIQLEQLAATEEPLGNLTADVSLGKEAVSVTANGEILGGRVDVKTKSPLSDPTSWKTLSTRILIGFLRIDRASLKRLSSLYQMRPQRFDGELSAIVRLGPDTVEAELTAGKVTAFGKTVADRMLMRTTLKDGDVQIQEIRGTYAGGAVSGRGVWEKSGTRFVRLRLTRANADRLLVPISRSADDWIGGRISGSALLTSSANDTASRLRITGLADVRDGTLFGVPVGDVHSPYVLTVSMEPMKWSVDFDHVQTTVANGRGEGRLILRSAAARQRGFHLDSNWRLTHVNFRDILRRSAGTAIVGRGDLTGTATLSGRHIQSEKDLEGRFRFQLGGTDAGAVPGVVSAGSFIGAAGLAGTRFNEGHAYGRIRRGVATVEECIMTASTLGFEADGTVNLTSGRLDIDAVLATGNFQGQTSVLRQTLRPRVVDAIGIGTINQILSDRTVVFTMKGNVRSPIVQLNPGETLRANTRSIAVRQLSTAITAGTILAP
ncbi:MAG: AsmA-like C-terminal region-containing protein [Planctomycetaceae bacterium]